MTLYWLSTPKKSVILLIFPTTLILLILDFFEEVTISIPDYFDYLVFVFDTDNYELTSEALNFSLYYPGFKEVIAFDLGVFPRLRFHLLGLFWDLCDLELLKKLLHSLFSRILLVLVLFLSGE